MSRRGAASGSGDLSDFWESIESIRRFSSDSKNRCSEISFAFCLLLLTTIIIVMVIIFTHIIFMYC